MTITDSGKDIALTGKSGNTFIGRIYEDKNASSSIESAAIVCLSNSQLIDGAWHHTIKDIYDTADIEHTLEHFRERDDISHLILIPRTSYNPMNWDLIDDLRRNYIHN
jgi:hypothetical protein